MEKIPPKYFLYLALAVVAGLIFAFGLASMMHQPLPVQVPLTQYQPAAPPAPAVPTIAPAVTATGNPFAPAPPPVIVTTAPLPTITPAENKAATNVYCPSLNKATGSLSSMWIIMMIVGFIMMMAFMRDSGTGGLMSGIILFIMMTLLLMVMPTVLDAVIMTGPCIAVPP